MRNLRRWLLPTPGLMLLLIAAQSARAQFPLKDGDIWVMAGDSITAQHLHSNYFEAFCYARYPKLKFGFRNSGVGGHTIPSTLARFDYDIAAWKPTVVSVELGMNDQGGTPTPKFVANMETMIKRIESIKARPIIFSPSPINNGDTLARLGGNKRLDEYSTALGNLCEREKLPYADQFHALIDIWGKNKPNENRLAAIDAVKKVAGNKDLEGVEHLREFLAIQQKTASKLVSMKGDPVHPGAPGQLMMAAALLKALKAEPFVSSVDVFPEPGKQDGTPIFEAKGCSIKNLQGKDFGISFDRLDECLPFPIPEDARMVLPLDPTILHMSQYMLKVKGLKGGAYQLKVNGVPIARLTSEQLAAGVNLTAFGSDPKSKKPNPIAAQGKAVLDAVSARAGLVGQWRGLSKQAHTPNAPPELMTKLAALTQRALEADERIRVAARPKVLHFEVTPVR